MPLRCRGLPRRHRHELETWTTETWIATAPAEVVAVMVEPDAIARWSSVPHELLELYGDPLESGSPRCLQGPRNPQQAAVHRRDPRAVLARDAHPGAGDQHLLAAATIVVRESVDKIAGITALAVIASAFTIQLFGSTIDRYARAQHSAGGRS
jgi:hypothetical protein